MSRRMRVPASSKRADSEICRQWGGDTHPEACRCKPTLPSWQPIEKHAIQKDTIGGTASCLNATTAGATASTVSTPH